MNHKSNGQHARAQVVVGLAVIAIGFLFLFDNLGWLDIELGMQFWPIVLIAAGVLRLSQGRSGRAASSAPRWCWSACCCCCEPWDCCLSAGTCWPPRS
ncbi:LiaI-LiaF-like domain-containing protein [Pseudoduganella armeniaca]|uniref:LiaI-LiaF-like domain-containing protein n=1 Tax=Pseudoduganella armeniaca TaxID=2072590 RepID=UPI001E47DC90|nr:DUF5668 domain-containing protein [Pseudoduganella armeniaca]